LAGEPVSALRTARLQSLRITLESRSMTRLRSSLLGLLLATCVISCVERLPNAHDMDRYYDVARVEAKDRIAELESRRAAGTIDEFGYKREKEAIDRYIEDRAHTLAWTGHHLRETGMSAVGIPTPDHPQEIAVPQAGSLPTGSDFRRFNQSQYGSASSNTTISDMRQMMGNTQPGGNLRPQNTGR
jgi:hypothetical protein